VTKLLSVENRTSEGPPIFIVGCFRSGTTLLRAMLANHPDVAIPPESHFIPRVWAVRRRYGDGGAFDAHRLVSDITATARFKQWHLPKEVVLNHVREVNPRDFAATIEAVFTAYARHHDRRRWGDKTPGYSLELRLLGRLFPSARFINIVRDGRDVALSFIEMGATSRLVDVATAWATRVRKARADGIALGRDRYVEVRYEDLIEDPTRIVEQVCSHVDLDFRPEMLEYYKGIDRLVPHGERHIHRNLGRPPTKGLRDWRTQMDKADVRLFEAVAGNELTDFGYERVARAIPARSRARALAAKMGNAGTRLSWSTRRWALLRLKPNSLPLPRRW